tara:strand:+ start:2829 stop:5228 length:2400 start_codon:yes stop_codon:yes gene_type:complete
MSSCVTKYIDEFCENFLSLNVSFGPESDLLIEVESLGDKEIPINSDVFQKYLPGTIKFELLQKTTKKSSGGVVTSCRYGDPVAREFKTHTIGTLEAGGDVIIGQEYFMVTGMPNVNSRSNRTNLNFLKRALDYRRIHAVLDRKTDVLVRALNEAGRIVSVEKGGGAEKLHVPGYPDPNIEFGQWLYGFAEFQNKTKTQFYNFKTNVLGATKEAAGLPNLLLPPGLYSDSGTIQSVGNSILGGTGGIMVASSLFSQIGPVIIDASQDLGKIKVLDDAGIYIPDEAESSSVSISYTDSYSSGAQVLSKTTGRLPDNRPEEMGAMSGDFETIQTTSQVYQDSSERAGRGYTTTVFNPLRVENEDRETYVWLNIRDLGVVREYGLALALENHGTLVDDKKYIESLFGEPWTKDGRKTYSDAEVAITENDPLTAVREEKLSDADENVNETLFSFKLSNYNRYHFVNESFDHFSSEGGTEEDPDLIGFTNFGLANDPRGSKTWASKSGGNISFIEFDTSFQDSPFGELKVSEDFQGVGSFYNFCQKTGVTSSDKATAGKIMLDFGPVIEPTFAGLDEDYTKYENLIDFSPSNFATGETIFGGLASAATEKLGEIVDRVIAKYENIYDDLLKQNPSETSGVKANGPEQYEKIGSARIPSQKQGEVSGYWSSRKIPRRGPYMSGCRSNSARFNRSDSFSTVSFTTELTEDGNAIYYNGGDQGVSHLAVDRTCKNQVDIPYLEKRSFTLINQLYDFEANPHHLRFLESASINVNNGKLIANYTFSQKIYIPNFTKLGEGMASRRNLFR